MKLRLTATIDHDGEDDVWHGAIPDLAIFIYEEDRADVLEELVRLTRLHTLADTNDIELDFTGPQS
jgi:hypothetical protein